MITKDFQRIRGKSFVIMKSRADASCGHGRRSAPHAVIDRRQRARLTLDDFMKFPECRGAPAPDIPAGRARRPHPTGAPGEDLGWLCTP
jgi:hypothetical protein